MGQESATVHGIPCPVTSSAARWQFPATTLITTSIAFGNRPKIGPLVVETGSHCCAGSRRSG